MDQELSDLVKPWLKDLQWLGWAYNYQEACTKHKNQARKTETRKKPCVMTEASHDLTTVPVCYPWIHLQSLVSLSIDL